MALSDQTLSDLREEAAAIEMRRKRRAEEDKADSERIAAIQVLLKSDAAEIEKRQPSLTLPRNMDTAFIFGSQESGEEPSFRDRVRTTLITNQGRKMTIGEVVEALERAGFRHEGKTPIKIKVGNELYKMSHQQKELIGGNGKGLYWAKQAH